MVYLVGVKSERIKNKVKKSGKKNMIEVIVWLTRENESDSSGV